MLKFLLLIFLSSNVFSDTASSLVQDAETFVNQLNFIFKIQVKLKEVPKCGFSTKEPVNGVNYIYFCRKDIEFFEELQVKERPVDSLLTIIAHEYSHFLLDWDLSSDAIDTRSDFLYDQAAESIFHKIRDNEDIKVRLLKFTRSSSENESESSYDEKLKDAIVSFLLFGDHANNDGFGAKLMLMASKTPNPNVMTFYPDLGQKVLKERAGVIEQSTKDGLKSWSNYLCIGPGRNLSGSNLILNRYLDQNNLNTILETLNNECTVEEVILNFFILFDKYVPPLSETSKR